MVPKGGYGPLAVNDGESNLLGNKNTIVRAESGQPVFELPIALDQSIVLLAGSG